MKHLLVPISIFITFSAYAQPVSKNDSSSLFKVGYQNLILTDSGRTYKPGVHRTGKFYYRPLEIDIWYPAMNTKSTSPIQYGEFLDLLQQRSNRFQNDTVYKNLTSDLLQYICINLDIGDTAKLSHLKTKSYLNAQKIQQRFPLIVYMCAYNGMSYENVNLFEWLAGHGYIIACITSVGRYPGNMSTDSADLMQQAYDGSFAIDYLKNMNSVDSAKIGVMGYSWGGLAALILATINTGVKAVLSFDGSEMHYYGDSREEDKQFDVLRNSYLLKKLNAPYAYLESGFKQRDRDVDSIFNILPSLTGQKQYVRFQMATHEDFSCIPSLSLMGKNDKAGLYKLFKQLALAYFDQYVKDQGHDESAQLSAIYQQYIADSLYPVIPSMKKNGLSLKETTDVNKHEFILEGRVIDAKNKDALSYVNVGVPGKNIGTVTKRDGSFQIKVNPDLSVDSMKISTVGYQSVALSIADLLKEPKPVVIMLNEKMSELKEVVVSTKLLTTKIKGNTTTSNFINIGLPLKFLGSETGVRLSLGKKPVLLKSFTFNISENRLDTAVFRLNVYNFKKGVPFENMLHQNILVPVGKQTGRYRLDLSPYKLIVKGDVLISLEWIEGSASAHGNGAIFLSAGFLNSATWHRLTSQAEWKKASGLGVGFNAVIQELRN